MTAQPAPAALAAEPVSLDTAVLLALTDSAAANRDAQTAQIISELRRLAQSISPDTRQQIGNEQGENSEYLDAGKFQQRLTALFSNGHHVVAEQILDDLSLADAQLVANYPGSQFQSPAEFSAKLQKLLQQDPQFRAELHRQKLLRLAAQQNSEYTKLQRQVTTELGIDGLTALIDQLGRRPVRRGRLQVADDPGQAPLDPTISNSPENTLLRAALLALKHNEARTLAGSNPQVLQEHTRRFVLGVLNPTSQISVVDITDVYGAESNLPANAAANDATLARVDSHWKEVEGRYGVKVERFNQGASINCPEQCGAFALAAVNQARRADTQHSIQPRFFILNNASRTEDADGLTGGEASQSSSLLYFSFDVGDGVVHSGVAYGHQTLTLLKPYIIDLFEIEGTDRGTQFRSLEHEKHIAALSALGDGAAPAAYPLKPLNSKEAIPDLKLAANEALFLGTDKYLNGLTSSDAEEFFAQFLPAGEDYVQVKVTILDRKHQVIVAPEQYALARSLGSVRDGAQALWESSTPTSTNPKGGLLSIGVFKAKRDDINGSLLKAPEGSIIRVEKI